jgi:hypothetical protein
MRRLTTLGLSVSMALTGAALGTSASVVGAAAAAPVVHPTQEFAGSGTGTLALSNPPTVGHDGGYSSIGQIGLGSFHFEDGVAHGHARFTRSDGMTLTGTTAPTPGACGSIPATAHCITADLSGTADIPHASVKLVVTDDFGKAPKTSFTMRGTQTLNRRVGYVMVDPSGSLYRLGGLEISDDVNTTGVTDVVVGQAGTGGWILNATGHVFTFGAAHKFNSSGSVSLAAGERVGSFSVTPTERGYWLFTSKGRVLPFGDAHFFGDMHSTPLNGGIVGSIASPTGKGYYMVGTDGGIFAFGDAQFRGSMGNVRLNQPVVGLVPTATNKGYWLVASDGGVFSFGDATFHGSMGGTPLNKPVVTMVGYAGSYMMIASDGGIFNFSTGPFFGSLGDGTLPEPIVSGASAG